MLHVLPIRVPLFNIFRWRALIRNHFSCVILCFLFSLDLVEGFWKDEKLNVSRKATLRFLDRTYCNFPWLSILCATISMFCFWESHCFLPALSLYFLVRKVKYKSRIVCSVSHDDDWQSIHERRIMRDYDVSLEEKWNPCEKTDDPNFEIWRFKSRSPASSCRVVMSLNRRSPIWSCTHKRDWTWVWPPPTSILKIILDFSATSK